MDINGEKSRLTDTINKLLAMDAIDGTRAKDALNGLLAEMRQNFYTVVVLGEFKRGKSTFINALLGEPLLPMDVLPETAAIHILVHSDEPRLAVVYRDGHEESAELSADYLRRFSAKNPDTDLLESVSYLKIGLPFELLKNRIVLVDTPGVSDLNTQRCEVTYSFVPRANAVLFLLDATSPLKKTEKEFIDEQLIAAGIKNIIFLLNRYDCVDEEEDADLLPSVRQRLAGAFKNLGEIEVLPLSAKMALNARQSGDDGELEASGLPAVQQRLEAMLYSGDLERQKVAAWQVRLKNIAAMIDRDLERQEQLKAADAAQIDAACQAVRDSIEGKAQYRANIAEYTAASREQINAMIAKSLRYFGSRLEEEITHAVDRYKGTDFKDFVEQDITRQIRRNVEGWTRQYAPNIDLLLQKLESELARGLSYAFNQKIRLAANKTTELRHESLPLALEADDLSMTTVKAGAMMAAGGAVLLMATGGLLMPFISMAAFPFLRERMLKQKLDEAKAKVLPALSDMIRNLVENLRVEASKYVETSSAAIAQNTELAFDSVLEDMRNQLETELSSKKAASADAAHEAERLREARETVRGLVTEVSP